MKFGAVPLAEAEGTILGHTHRVGDRTFKKGRQLSTADVAAFAAAGHQTVVVARLEEGDLSEDEAAARIARRTQGQNVEREEASTGRANLFATARGLLVVDRDRLDAINLVDEAITIATLEPFSRVEVGDMVATVKIIPFAVSRAAAAKVEEAAQGAPVIRVAPLSAASAGLVLTTLPGVHASQLDRAEESQRARLRALGGAVERTLRVPHDASAVAEAIGQLTATGLAPILVLGASAITDRNDVVPEALRRAGGVVEHVGMPVDPGNLLMFGRLGQVPVIGVPGCARSLARSGFDRVLERVLAGIEVTSRDLMRMGAGGLMKDTEARPHPRRLASSSAPRAIAAVVLAAGRSTRMGAANKLLRVVHGQPMIARVVDMLLESKVSRIVVVLGHQASEVRAALGDRAVQVVHNPSYAEGLSTSIRAGAAAMAGVSNPVDGALFVLGDMPWVSATHVQRLIESFEPESGRSICVPVYEGRRGNPVLWAARYFREMEKLTGDVGARPLLAEHADQVFEVKVEDRGVHFDVDTPEALEELLSHGTPSAGQGPSGT